MILNRQRGVRVPIQDLDRFVARVQRKFRTPSDAFTVCLVTDHQIARWNKAFRGKKGATDVLSFPMQGHTGERGSKRGRGKASSASRRALTNGNAKQRKVRSEPDSSESISRSGGFSSTSFTSSISSTSYLGDIAIAPAVARKNARRLGRTLNHELRFLVLHGFLHLLGYDHETDSGEMEYIETMLSRVFRLS